MRWTLLAVLACSLGCSRPSPVQPSGTTGGSNPTPSKSFSISGVVRESGTNAPLEGASVCWSNNAEPHCGRTAADGSYTFVVPEGLAVPPTARDVQICPGASKPGFEHRQTCVAWSAGASWSPVLQQTIQIDAGGSLTGTVYPEEGSGLARADDCQGCKRIRIAIPRAGTLSVQLPVDPGTRLRLALVGVETLLPLEGPLAVAAGEIVTVVVTGAVTPAEFVLSTSLASAK